MKMNRVVKTIALYSIPFSVLGFGLCSLISNNSNSSASWTKQVLQEVCSPRGMHLNKCKKPNRLINPNNSLPIDYPILNNYWYLGSVCCAGCNGVLYTSGTKYIFLSVNTGEVKWVHEYQEVGHNCIKLQYVPAPKYFLSINENDTSYYIRTFDAIIGKQIDIKWLMNWNHSNKHMWILTPITGTNDFWLIPQQGITLSSIDIYKICIANNGSLDLQMNCINKKSIRYSKKYEQIVILCAGAIESKGTKNQLIIYWSKVSQKVIIRFFNKTWSNYFKTDLFDNIKLEVVQNYLKSGVKEFKLNIGNNNKVWATIPFWWKLDSQSCCILSLEFNKNEMVLNKLQMNNISKNYCFKNMIYSTCNDSYVGWSDHLFLEGHGCWCDIPIRLRNVKDPKKEDFDISKFTEDRKCKKVFSAYTNIMPFTDSHSDTHCAIIENDVLIIFQKSKLNSIVLVNCNGDWGNGVLCYQTVFTTYTYLLEIDNISNLYAINYRNNDDLRTIIKLGDIRRIIKHFRIDSSFYFSDFNDDDYYNELYRGDISAKITLTKAFNNMTIDCTSLTIPLRITFTGFKKMTTKHILTNFNIERTCFGLRTTENVAPKEIAQFIFNHRNEFFEDLPYDFKEDNIVISNVKDDIARWN